MRLQTRGAEIKCGAAGPPLASGEPSTLRVASFLTKIVGVGAGGLDLLDELIVTATRVDGSASKTIDLGPGSPG